MTRFLVATGSVHTAAAACDYLESRLGPEDDVLVLSVREPDTPARDPGDATNVARVRLAAAGTVEVEHREGDPTAAIRAVAAESDPDELVIGARRGDPGPGEATVGSTARELLAAADRPVVVVPLPALT